MAEKLAVYDPDTGSCEWKTYIPSSTSGGPLVNPVAISYTPELSGNTENLNELVTTQDGLVYFIDSQGTSVNLCCADVPVMVGTDIVFQCIPQPTATAWSDDQEVLITSSTNYSIDQADPVQIPFKIGYKATDRGNWLVTGLSTTAGGVANATHVGLIGIRHDNHYIYTSFGENSDPAGITDLSDVLVEIEGTASGEIKIYFDGVLDSTKSSQLLAGTDYFPTVNSGTSSTVEYYSLNGYSVPTVSATLRKFEVGATYEVVLETTPEQVLLEFTGTDSGTLPLQQNWETTLHSLGLTPGNYEIYVRDKDFPSQIKTASTPFVYDDCLDEASVISAVYECVPQPGIKNTWGEYDGAWLNDSGVVGTQLVSDSDDDGQLSLQTNSWTVGQTFPEALALPLTVRWNKRSNNANFWLTLFRHDRIGVSDPGYALNDGLGIQSNTGQGAYTRGMFGNSGWHGGWDWFWEIRMYDAGDGTFNADLVGINPVTGDETVFRSRTGLSSRDRALAIGYNADINLEIESASFLAADQGVVTIEFDDPNGASPYQVVDEAGTVHADVSASPVAFNYVGDGTVSKFKVVSTLNTDITTDLVEVQTTVCT